jgi:uncharacterized protein (TIGR02246 family)
MSDETSMSRREAAAALAVGALAVAAASPAEAKPEKTMSPGLKALMMAHNKAFDNHDLKGVLATMSPHAVLMGTGPGELWVGHAEISEAYKHFFGDFDKGGQKIQDLWWDEKMGSDLASLMAMTKVTMTAKGKANDVGINMSMVAEKQKNGSWLIRNMHFSNRTGKAQE